ncbi:hypothetical protein L6R29_19580 [Myxococcota bacterium]|nr:hypothetical protein [Myxococcota bacterium]
MRACWFGRGLWGRSALLLGWLFVFSACSSSGNSGCSCMSEIPGGFPEAAKLDNIVQLKVTDRGFQFIGQNTNALVKQFLPNGLSFDVPPDTSGDPKICHKGGTCTVNGKINSASITPTPPKTLKAKINLDMSSNKIPISYKLLVTINCDLEVTISKKDISIDLNLSIDSRNKGLRIDLGTPSFSLENKDFKLSGNVGCSLINALKGLFTGLIEKEVKKALKDAIDGATCMSCKQDSECGFGTTCKDEICTDGKACLPMVMGFEGRIATSTLLGEFGNPTAQPVDMAMQMGGSVEVQTSGMRLGSLGGSQSTPHACIKAPNFPKLPSPAALTFPTASPDGSPYMVGVGISQTMLTQFMRDLYQSGALCLRLDSGISDQLGTFFRAQGIGAAVSPSLLQLVGKDNPPLYIVLQPNEPIDLSIGKGEITKDKDGNAVVKEPLLEMRIPKIDFTFYMVLYDRWVRLLTFRTDIVLPMALETRPNNKIGLLLGDLKQAFQNPQVLNSNLIKEKNEDVATNFASTLQALIPVLIGQIGSTEFDIPELQGFKLSIRGMTGIVPRTDRPDRFQFLGLFADLALAPPAIPQMPAVRGLALRPAMPLIPPSLWSDLQSARPIRAYPSVSIDILDGDPAWAYAVRVNQGPWQAFVASQRLRVESPQFLMQGEHTVMVRARRVDQPQGTEVAIGSVPIRVDYTPPAIQARIQPQGIFLEAVDHGDPHAPVRFSYRLDGQTLWSPTEAFLPAARLTPNTTVSLRAQDAAGNVTTLPPIDWKPTLHQAEQHVVALPRLGFPSPFLSDKASPHSPPPACGCQTTPVSPVAWMVWFGLLFFLRVRKKA